jgi:hypothetical protein
MKVVDPSYLSQKNTGLNQIGAVKKQMALSTTACLPVTGLTTHAQTGVSVTGARWAYLLPWLRHPG